MKKCTWRVSYSYYTDCRNFGRLFINTDSLDNIEIALAKVHKITTDKISISTISREEDTIIAIMDNDLIHY